MPDPTITLLKHYLIHLTKPTKEERIVMKSIYYIKETVEVFNCLDSGERR